jgi:putative PIG3 family NAD(P)H quinone oxidoreductase
MAAVIARQPGGPESLVQVERPVPRPRCGEVLIKVAAAGANGADLLQRRGQYPLREGTTDILGLEASGEIVALGEGVTEWKVGDAVCALLIGGGYAEYCVTPSVQCLPVPRGLTIVQAAALPEVVFTVWSNVFEIGSLRPGETLLAHGGASGIGTTAIQLARGLGSRVFATAGSPEKCRRVEQLGAARGIDYKQEDFVAVIEQETAGAGVDVILDMVGGSYLPRDLMALAPGGRLVMLSHKQGSRVELDCGLIQRKHLTVTGSGLRWRPVAEKGRLAAAIRKAVWPLIQEGRVRPVIDSTFPLRDARSAHERMESGLHIGKVLLTTGPSAP